MSSEHNQADVLYSFRRCPYAMRARLAIAASQHCVEIREVVLRDKPRALIDASPKATVPVLITAQGDVIDESLDIMHWALTAHDPLGWYQTLDSKQLSDAADLIAWNDGQFKYYLDRYKYADRYPEHDQAFYRSQGAEFLALLEQRLQTQPALTGDRVGYADMAIAPFIRQFAMVDQQWFFNQTHLVALHDWLHNILNSTLFQRVMIKLPQWHAGDEPRFFP